jgi:hypothetical protein
MACRIRRSVGRSRSVDPRAVQHGHRSMGPLRKRRVIHASGFMAGFPLAKVPFRDGVEFF